MTILITGASGLIGSEIIALLENENTQVHYLSTKQNKLKTTAKVKGFFWDPKTGYIDVACFKNVEVIIHLAGASISKKWTTAYKNEIMTSRIETTAILVTALKTIKHNVKQVISASAIGIYPHSFSKRYTELTSVKSQSFLGEVVLAWEQAVNAFLKLNIKVTKVRIGLVLAKNGGALPEIVKPINWGLGASFGSGQQWQSWIHVTDLARLFLHCLTNTLEGVYNGVAPQPVTNLQLTKAVAKHLKRPLFFPNIPKNIMQLILGERHILLFESQNVKSDKIEDANFKFSYPTVELALKNILNS